MNHEKTSKTCKYFLRSRVNRKQIKTKTHTESQTHMSDEEEGSC